MAEDIMMSVSSGAEERVLDGDAGSFEEQKGWSQGTVSIT